MQHFKPNAPRKPKGSACSKLQQARSHASHMRICWNVCTGTACGNANSPCTGETSLRHSAANLHTQARPQPVRNTRVGSSKMPDSLALLVEVKGSDTQVASDIGFPSLCRAGLVARLRIYYQALSHHKLPGCHCAGTAFTAAWTPRLAALSTRLVWLNP